MGGGTGTGGQDPRWQRIKALEAEIKTLKREMHHHAPTVADYERTGYGFPYPTGPVPGAPGVCGPIFRCPFCGTTDQDGRRCPKAAGIRHPLPRPAIPPRPTVPPKPAERMGPPPPPPPETDPAGPHSRWAFTCCWKGMIWPWHRCK